MRGLGFRNIGLRRFGCVAMAGMGCGMNQSHGGVVSEGSAQLGDNYREVAFGSSGRDSEDAMAIN